MWQPSSALAAWHAAMDAQTAHEAVCSPCAVNRTPACAEGARLQRDARNAHRDWVSSEYAGRAVA